MQPINHTSRSLAYQSQPFQKAVFVPIDPTLDELAAFVAIGVDPGPGAGLAQLARGARWHSCPPRSAGGHFKRELEGVRLRYKVKLFQHLLPNRGPAAERFSMP